MFKWNAGILFASLIPAIGLIFIFSSLNPRRNEIDSISRNNLENIRVAQTSYLKIKREYASGYIVQNRRNGLRHLGIDSLPGTHWRDEPMRYYYTDPNDSLWKAVAGDSVLAFEVLIGSPMIAGLTTCITMDGKLFISRSPFNNIQLRMQGRTSTWD